MADDVFEQAERHLQLGLDVVAHKIAQEDPEVSGNVNGIAIYAKQLTDIAEAHRVVLLIRSGQFYGK